jgi:hypothetical protein
MYLTNPTRLFTSVTLDVPGPPPSRVSEIPIRHLSVGALIWESVRQFGSHALVSYHRRAMEWEKLFGARPKRLPVCAAFVPDEMDMGTVYRLRFVRYVSWCGTGWRARLLDRSFWHRTVYGALTSSRAARDFTRPRDARRDRGTRLLFDGHCMARVSFRTIDPPRGNPRRLDGTWRLRTGTSLLNCFRV